MSCTVGSLHGLTSSSGCSNINQAPAPFRKRDCREWEGSRSDEEKKRLCCGASDPATSSGSTSDTSSSDDSISYLMSPRFLWRGHSLTWRRKLKGDRILYDKLFHGKMDAWVYKGETDGMLPNGMGVCQVSGEFRYEGQFEKGEFCDRDNWRSFNGTPCLGNFLNRKSTIDLAPERCTDCEQQDNDFTRETPLLSME